MPLARGIQAFGEGGYEDAVRWIEPLDGQLVRVGGSHAQWEVFEDTLLHAYLRTGRFDAAADLLRRRLSKRSSARDIVWLEQATAGAARLDERSDDRLAATTFSRPTTAWPLSTPRGSSRNWTASRSTGTSWTGSGSWPGRSGQSATSGVGQGQIARYLAERGLETVGVDLSPGMIDEARRLNPGLRFEQGTMLALDFEDDELGGIAAFYSIVNVPRDGAAAGVRRGVPGAQAGRLAAGRVPHRRGHGAP